MWKWILWIVLAIIVFVGWRITTMYQAFAAGGDSTTTMIAATRDRVFEALTNTDSMQVWMGENATVTSTRRGDMQVGDTLRIDEGSGRATTTAVSKDGVAGKSRGTIIWIVSEVTPGKVLALSLQSDSTKSVVATQRDSLVQVGDSIQLITTIAVPVMDSIRNTRGDSGGKVGGAMLNFGSKMMIGAFRKISEIDRIKLKAHLEGHVPTVAP
jgi:hypothetical protein